MPPRGPVAALAALVVVLALALAAGWGEAARAQADCPRFDLADLRASIEGVDVVVVGEVAALEGAPAIAPEAYLKGAAVSGLLPLSEAPSGCARAVPPPAGTRVVAALRREGGGFQWPVPAALFAVADGVATNGADPPVSLPEDELVSRIRAVSGQYAVPATEPSEGASVNWLGVVLPVSLAAALILAIALVLLRIWHRIEPE